MNNPETMSVCYIIKYDKVVISMESCPMNTFLYALRPGDTLQQLAQRFNTSVHAIMIANPGLNPSMMYVGQAIYIRPGYGYLAGIRAAPAGGRTSAAELVNDMRMLWEQHVAWTRMTIISMAAGLPDTEAVTQRLLRNPDDFEKALTPYYGREKAANFSRLFKTHLVIAAELVRAAKAGDSKAAADAEKRWYANADEIAAYLSSINPYWSEQALKTMLHEHLALTKEEAVERLNQNYEADIAVYDRIEKQALTMADVLARGIVKQFPGMFTV